MPGENIQDWSTTAATNSSADSSINWAEGQARNSVNNSARSMMAAHAKNRNLLNGSIITTGTANVQAFLSGLSYSTVPTGLRVLLKIGAGLTNTAAATLSMDFITAVSILDRNGLALSGGELVAGTYVEFVFNGANWCLLGFAGEHQFIEAVGAAFPSFGAGVWAPLVQITIPAGDWDIYGGCEVTGLATGGLFYLSIAAVPGTPTTVGGSITTTPSAADIWATVGPVRVNTPTAIFYLLAQNSTAGAGVIPAPRIYARRMR